MSEISELIEVPDTYFSSDEVENIKEAKSYFNYLYSIFQLEKILVENNKNVEDIKFVELSKNLKMDIDMAQIIDEHLHSNFKEIIDNVEDKSRLAVLWKTPLKNVKLGDEINGGKVIGIFTLTIWIYLKEGIGNEYCCTSCNCK